MPLIVKENLSDKITILTLNHPEKRNALSIDLMEELHQAIKEIENNPKKRVILLKGSGKSFCTGLDLQEAQKQDLAHVSAEHVAKLLHTISSTHLVSISLIHGMVAAGGAGLAIACDLTIAAEGTQIGFPEVRRGLVPGLIMTFLIRQLSQKHLNELLLLGEWISAERAASMGLINGIASFETLLEEGMRMASLAIQGAPGAIAHTKRLINSLHSPTPSDALQKALSHHMEARESVEAEEGLAAFVDKRRPSWAD